MIVEIFVKTRMKSFAFCIDFDEALIKLILLLPESSVNLINQNCLLKRRGNNLSLKKSSWNPECVFIFFIAKIGNYL